MLGLDVLIPFLWPSVITVDGNKAGYFYIVDSENCSLRRKLRSQQKALKKLSDQHLSRRSAVFTVLRYVIKSRYGKNSVLFCLFQIGQFSHNRDFKIQLVSRKPTYFFSGGI